MSGDSNDNNFGAGGSDNDSYLTQEGSMTSGQPQPADTTDSPALHRTKNLASDLQGAGKLAVDAVHGVTDIAEALHSTIHRLGGLLGKEKTPHRTRGITGLVYNNIRTVTDLVGKGIDLPLRQLAQILEESSSSPQREAVVAAINGVLGDHLYSMQNPLAIAMQLRYQGATIDSARLQKLLKNSSGRLTLMIHGLCMNDLQWTCRQHNHGEGLSRELDVVPLYLHYNTGLHISENGRGLAELLENTLGNLLNGATSATITEFNVVAHSMGGLVVRSACFYATQAQHRWLERLGKIVFLGTPHHGAVLERGGNWIDTLLGVTPYSAPFARIAKIRSSGVTDLRHGNIIDDHWQYTDRFSKTRDQRAPVPLPRDVACYAIGATKTTTDSKLGERIIGDGLVPLHSALGHHKQPALKLNFPQEHQWVGRGIHHFELLSDQTIYRQIRYWLE